MGQKYLYVVCHWLNYVCSLYIMMDIVNRWLMKFMNDNEYMLMNDCEKRLNNNVFIYEYLFKSYLFVHIVCTCKICSHWEKKKTEKYAIKIWITILLSFVVLRYMPS